MTSESSSPATEVLAPKTEFSSLRAKFRSVVRLPNHEIVAQLAQLNQQNHRLEAELLLYLGELDRRQIYREQAVASAFEFCVLRLGYSEDVAFKRVGAARLMRRFPLIYDLLVAGRIHLSALMLLKPHLTEENHEEWLLLACEKSKRQVEKLVAARCPRPDVPASIRKLPDAKHSSVERTPPLVAVNRDKMEGASGQASATTAQPTTAQPTTAQPTTAQPTTAQPTTAQPTTAQATTAQARMTTAGQVSGALHVAPSVQVAPLSSRTYRVTFTASERLKEKLDRAGELLSHCIRPSDLPALIERALDQLLEREEKRRYGARPPSDPQSVEPACGARSSQVDQSPKAPSVEPALRDSSSQTVRASRSQSVELATEFEQGSCQEVHFEPNELKDPDLVPALDFARPRNGHGGTNGTGLASAQRTRIATQRATRVKTKCRRRVPAAVRRAVFERDGGQCTFVDEQGRRCMQRHFLELDHIDAHALGGTETVTNLRLRCAMHNALEAERLFGRGRIGNAIRHTQQKRTQQVRS